MLRAFGGEYGLVHAGQIGTILDLTNPRRSGGQAMAKPRTNARTDDDPRVEALALD
ncbi:GntR family transcriptional regulator, partial [Xanthomonas oryzae pv. oryzae]